MGKKSILIISERCTGCRACQVACKNWNDLPAQKTSFTGSFNSPTDLTAVNFNRINFTEVLSEKDHIRWLFVSQRCMHCTDAGCMKICSTLGALTRNEEGAVVTNQEKCAGCHLCIAGCPFNVPRYGKDGKLAKCTMCADRIPKGMSPACVHTCPPQPLTFGDRDELIASACKMGYPTIYGQMNLGGLGTMHKLNTGQKAFYLCLLIFGFAIILSGAGIWLMPNHQVVMVWSVIIHNISFILIGIFFPIHLYLSTLRNPGTLRIMLSGTVPVWLARKKSQQWVEEVEEGRSH